jgi:glycerol-3-phosphate acyltransferase PlsY
MLGSVLPAEILARRRGIDIRSVGDGNPGTVNAIRVLGWAPGLFTAVYDVSVGVVAILFARLIGVADGPAYLAGIMTIVGHDFPVYTRFKGGGQGMATSAGMIVYGVAVALTRGWLSTVDLGVLLAILVVAFALTRSDSAAAAVMLPFFMARLVTAVPDWRFLAFMCAVTAYIWIVQVVVVRRWLASRSVRPARGRTRN